jgi:transposase
MFLRKKPNKSGKVSIQVVMKTKNRRQKVVKTIGSGFDAQEIERLVAEGHRFIDEQNGPMFPNFDETEADIDRFVHSIKNTQIQVIGPELIFGTLYDRIGYGAIHNDMFRHMVICRLFNPGSKLKTADYLERYLHVTYDINKIYRFLDNLCYRKDKPALESSAKKTKKKVPEDFKTLVERISYAHTKSVVGGEIAVCFYDMTTLYFEAAEEDDLRKCGFSKDGKHSCPQIFLGLLVATGGNPIGYEIYEGNIFEGKTIVPIVKSLSTRFGFDKPIVVADAGLLSKENIKALVADGYGFILGARPKSEPNPIKEQILSQKMEYGDIKEIRRTDDTRLILSCSEGRAGKDARNRAKGLARLQKKVTGGKLTKQHINNHGYNKYLRIDGDAAVSIDMEKYNADAAWDGIKGYVTNTKLTAEEVIEQYGNLWFIERAFRFNKFDLAVRPIYHRLRNRIEAHICICFTAYTILLELERILKSAHSKITVYRAQELTKNMFAIAYTQQLSKQTKVVRCGMTEEQEMLYNLICQIPK